MPGTGVVVDRKTIPVTPISSGHRWSCQRPSVVTSVTNSGLVAAPAWSGITETITDSSYNRLANKTDGRWSRFANSRIQILVNLASASWERFIMNNHLDKFPHIRQRLRDDHFEETRVKYVLKRFGLEHLKQPILSAFHEAYGEWELRFQWFYKSVPSFPIYLAAGRPADPLGLGLWKTRRKRVVKGDEQRRAEEAIAALLRNFPNSEAVRMQNELYDYPCPESEGRPHGLVFPCFGVRHGLVVHDWQSPITGSQVTHRFPNGHMISVCSFKSLLDAVAEIWPNTNEDGDSNDQHEEPLDLPIWPTLDVPTWVFHVTATHTEALILSYIIQASQQSIQDGAFRTVVRDGVRWVVTRQTSLAEMLNVSDRSVRNAIRGLSTDKSASPLIESRKSREKEPDGTTAKYSLLRPLPSSIMQTQQQSGYAS